MTLRDNPVARRTHAALLAASNAIISQRTVGRPPLAVTPPAGYVPASLRDVPDLLAGAKPIDRITGAALCYAFESPKRKGERGLRRGGYTERLLEKQEQEDFRKHIESGGGQPACRYCDVLYGLRSRWAKKKQSELVAQTVVVNHSAIETEFDVDGANISKASIDNFQLLLPRKNAIDVLLRSHPLNWADAAPDLFESVVPAKLGSDGWGRNPDTSPERWQERAERDGREFVLETAHWPWNEDVTLGVVNVIRVEHFDSNLQAKNPDEVPHLSYQYHLESCLRSDYGIISEELSGLDIDDGTFAGEAVPLTEAHKHVDHLTPDDFADLVRRRDLDLSVPDKFETDEEKRAFAKKLFGKIGTRWKGNKPWLLTITASKSLRYTVPQYVPVDLWATMTWMAPALLFSFMNTAVCQLPQLVDNEIKTGEQPTFTIGTAHGRLQQRPLEQLSRDGLPRANGQSLE